MVPLNAFSKMAKKRVFSQTAQFRESRKMDGQKDILYPDGTRVREFPDGRIRKTFPDGRTETKNN
jgi:hypothetical protein